jgi:hypothetical protein
MRLLLAYSLILVTGCTPNPAKCAASPSKAETFVVEKLTLPTKHEDFAIDLNGDGRVDNQLGSILDALISANIIDPQPLVDEALREGKDPMQLQRWDGGAVLFGELEPGHQQGWFCGDEPTELTLTLPYFADVTVHLVDAHLTLDQTDGGMSGQLQGAIRAEEIDAVVMPAVADYLNAKLTGDPDSSLSQSIRALFDDGGNGQCNGAGNGHIEPCEVRMNALARNLFAPDVQLFAADGSFAPDPTNQHRDSVSVGVAFTARQVD